MGEVTSLYPRGRSEPDNELDRRSRVGRAIRHLRGELTQADLGERLGVGQPAISGWEAGRVSLQAETLWRIEQATAAQHGFLFVAGGWVDPSLDPLMVLLEVSVTCLKRR